MLRNLLLCGLFFLTQVRVRLSVLEVLEDRARDLMSMYERADDVVVFEMAGQHVFLQNASVVTVEDQDSLLVGVSVSLGFSSTVFVYLCLWT